MPCFIRRNKPMCPLRDTKGRFMKDNSRKNLFETNPPCRRRRAEGPQGQPCALETEDRWKTWSRAQRITGHSVRGNRHQTR